MNDTFDPFTHPTYLFVMDELNDRKGRLRKVAEGTGIDYRKIDSLAAGRTKRIEWAMIVSLDHFFKHELEKKREILEANA